MRRAGLYLFISFFILNAVTPALAEKRVALVIGNSAYEHSARLNNPKNDARDMAASFTALKFTKVIVEYDLKYSDLRRALANFSRVAVGADLAVIYYSGHGIEVSGQNYLIPVDAKLSHAEDVAFEATPLTQAMVALERAGKFRMVILDACRDNPFRNRMKSSGSTRSIGKGLAPVAAGNNTLVAYASRDGTVAFDGDGTHSPYTTALLEHMEKPGIEVGYLFRLVRDSVLASTANRQEPFTYGSLGSRRIYLNPAQSNSTPARVTSSDAAQEWQTLQGSNDTGDLEAYIAQFGTASPYYARLAKKRLKALKEQKVASLPTDNSEELAKIAAKRAKAKRDLALAVQAELKRLGCDPGGVDGMWGANSSKAVRAYGKHAKIAINNTDPSAAFLKQLRKKRVRVCPEEIKIPQITTLKSNSEPKASYIAQIGIRRSRVAALNSFADLQKRFGAVLGKKTLDLQKKNFGSKGTWFRVRVGPPGSKQDMAELCSKLRSVGHMGCIIRAY